jgi:hypothetical protein
VTGIEAYNTSRLNLRAILADPGQLAFGRMDGVGG